MQPAPKAADPIAIPEPEATDKQASGEPVDAVPARVDTGGPKPRLGCTADERDRDGAKRAYQAGVEAYADADYARAAELFEQAYAGSCATPLLFNLANALERAGDRAAAADALEAYLAENPDLPSADEIRARIERLRSLRRRSGRP